MFIDDENKSYLTLENMTNWGVHRFLTGLIPPVEVRYKKSENKIYLSAWIMRGDPKDIIVEASSNAIKIKINNLMIPMLTEPLILRKRIALSEEVTSTFDPDERILYIEVPLKPAPARVDIPVHIKA